MNYANYSKTNTRPFNAGLVIAAAVAVSFVLALSTLAGA